MKYWLRVCLCVCALTSGGCSSSRPALDRFSQAYSAFSDNVDGVDATARMILDSHSRYLTESSLNSAARVVVGERSRYWAALARGVDTYASNRSRALAASEALASYDAGVLPMLGWFRGYVESMDGSVDTLIQAANAIPDAEARRQAVSVAEHARGVHTASVYVLAMVEKRFALQVNLLKRLVAYEGGLGRAITESQRESEELPRLIADTDREWRVAIGHWTSAKDGFNALKGRYGVKDYPSKWDSTRVGP